MIDTQRKPFTVAFVGDYFALTTTVELDLNEPDLAGKDDDEIADVAEDLAVNLLDSHYGWDIRSISTIEISVSEG